MEPTRSRIDITQHRATRRATALVGLICLGFVPALFAADLTDLKHSIVFGLTFKHWALLLVSALLVLISVFSALLVRLIRNLRHEINERQASEAALRKLTSAVIHSGSSILITDADGIIEYVNPKFTQLTGFSQADCYGQAIDCLRVTNGDQNPASSQHWSSELMRPDWKGEVLTRRKHGDSFWCSVSVSPVLGNDGRVSHQVISGEDITELKTANETMQRLALFDSLTGLVNRHMFIDRLEHAIKAARRDHQNIALLFLDLDQFKRINDTLGHDAGDRLLQVVATRLRACVREKDTVARLGGDEFTILLTDIRSTQDVTTVAQNILTALKAPISLNTHSVIVSTSIGITMAPTDTSAPDALMKNADLALYRAKEQGRDRYHFFTEELNIRAQRHMAIEQELRHALRFDEFDLYFQPQYKLATNELCSVEALVRWNHPTRGQVPPADFITVAEETGLIVEIGNWVLRNACMQVRMLQEMTAVPLHVAVNLSARQFRNPNLEQTIVEALNSSGLAAQCLELEVTESMLMDDLDDTIRRLNAIKATGVRLSIDDFGSGYSSLSYLKRLPVDTLKVDRQFVEDIPDDLNDMEITSAIIAVAHKLNLKVIAEGVETIDQRDFLLINKCDYAQGFLFSKPMSHEDLYRYLGKPEYRHTA